MANKSKGGLNKGIDALFGDNLIDDEESGSVMVKIYDIEPNVDRPRKEFKEDALKELADSIAEHGVIQPIIVRVRPDGGYRLIAGERRWRAARMAGLTEVPVIVKEISESEVMEIALVENLQREDLNPIEEAEGLMSLIKNYGFTREEAAKKVGKSRPAVANSMRLLALPTVVLNSVRDGKISAGHAKALLGLPTPEEMTEIATDIIQKGMSVRDTERAVKFKLKEKGEKKKDNRQRDRFYDEAEIAVSRETGRKCIIHGGKNDYGTIEVPFYNREDLTAIIKLLTGN